MRSKVFLCALMLLTIAEAGFSRGDQFQYINIDGSLTIHCDSRTQVVTCRDVFLDPWPYDIFIGPKNISAESVELKSTVGSESQMVVVDYNGQTGRSANVNIGVYSLFQKPLLKMGQNKVRYVLLRKNNTVLETDTFDVSVSRGKSRTCAPRHTETNNPEDCDYSYTLCQQYFRAQNYCK